MLIDKNRFIGITILGTILLAMVFLNQRFLIITLLLLVYFIAGQLSRQGDPVLLIKREFETDQFHPQVPFSVALTVTNSGYNIKTILIKELLPQGLRIVEGEETKLTQLRPGETTQLNYKLIGKRGKHQFRQVKFTFSDRLGLHYYSVLKKHTSTIYIKPDLQKIRRIDLRPAITKVHSGYYPSRKAGTGVDFFGIREYQTGDSRRHINWKITQRYSDNIYVNQFETDQIADIGIILDNRIKSYLPSQTGEPLFEHSVIAAASIAERLLIDGNRVALLLYGAQLGWTIPGYGKLQFERIMRALGQSSPGQSLVFENLAYIPTQLLPPKSQIIIITPLQIDDSSVLFQLRSRGYQILVVSPDPYILLKLDTADIGNKNRSLAIRITNIERKVTIEKIRRSGIRVLDWDIHTPLDVALSITLGRVFQTRY